MSGTLWKRSSFHSSYQPRLFQLILDPETGELSLQYTSLRERAMKAIKWSQVRAVTRAPPTADFEFTIRLRPGVKDGQLPADSTIHRVKPYPGLRARD